MPSMHPLLTHDLGLSGPRFPQYEGPFLPQPLHAQLPHSHPDGNTQVQFGSDLLITVPAPVSKGNDTLMEKKNTCWPHFFLDPQFKGNIETTFL